MGAQLLPDPEEEMADLQLADRLERLADERQSAAEGVDQAIIGLRQALERFHAADLAISKLAPDIARDLVTPHMQRGPLRRAFFHHELSPKHVLVDGMRYGAVPFALSCTPTLLLRRIAELRGEGEEQAA